MTNDTRRIAALNEIRKNIAERGFHTYGVTGGGYPHYGYTIGLSESIGAELVVAGAYFYSLKEVSEVIRGIADELRLPDGWVSQKFEFGSLGVFSLRKVHESWAKSLLLGVFDFYQVDSVNAFQIVPDEAHLTIEIPDLSQPWSPDLAPSWRWLHQEWTYPVPKDSVAITNLDALRGKRTTEVMRWEEDEWEIFAGAGPDVPEEERRVVPLGVLLAADESLIPVVNLTIGTGLWRDAVSEWHTWGSAAPAKDASEARKSD
jgi:hypothetical protein